MSIAGGSTATGGNGVGGASPKIWTPAVGLAGRAAAGFLETRRAAPALAAVLRVPAASGFFVAGLALTLAAANALGAAVPTAGAVAAAPATARTGGLAAALPVALRTALALDAVTVLAARDLATIGRSLEAVAFASAALSFRTTAGTEVRPVCCAATSRRAPSTTSNREPTGPSRSGCSTPPLSILVSSSLTSWSARLPLGRKILPISILSVRVSSVAVARLM